MLFLCSQCFWAVLACFVFFIRVWKVKVEVGPVCVLIIIIIVIVFISFFIFFEFFCCFCFVFFVGVLLVFFTCFVFTFVFVLGFFLLLLVLFIYVGAFIGYCSLLVFPWGVVFCFVPCVSWSVFGAFCLLFNVLFLSVCFVCFCWSVFCLFVFVGGHVFVLFCVCWSVFDVVISVFLACLFFIVLLSFCLFRAHCFPCNSIALLVECWFNICFYFCFGSCFLYLLSILLVSRCSHVICVCCLSLCWSTRDDCFIICFLYSCSFLCACF